MKIPARLQRIRSLRDKAHRTQSSEESRAGRCLCVKVNQRLAKSPPKDP
jgi:hypothetical protein